MLLRLPYGKRARSNRGFAFEEFAGPPVHEQFLWGNAALATALLIGRAFTARGWDMEPGDEREIGDLPAYTFEQDGEPEMQACAERYLTESEINTLLEAGLIPLASRARPQCRGCDPVSIGVGPTGTTGLVMAPPRSSLSDARAGEPGFMVLTAIPGPTTTRLVPAQHCGTLGLKLANIPAGLCWNTQMWNIQTPKPSFRVNGMPKNSGALSPCHFSYGTV